MSDLAITRAKIVSLLEEVAGIGLVHPYERYAATEQKLKALYVTGEQLEGWFVRRLSTSVTAPALKARIVIHRWRIRGYMALADADMSEIAFDERIEAIRAKFDESTSLGGVCETTHVDGLAGIQLDESAPVMFAGVLCHGARFSLFTRHRE